MSNQTNRINALTSLRFFAALMIILGHSSGIFFNARYINDFAIYQGVSFFFVLSGFILTYVYPDLAKQTVMKFYIARIARLWPAHIAALVLFLVMFHNTAIALLSQKLVLLSNVAMIQAWIPYPQFYFSFNAPSWSISTELFFYLCFPLLIYRWRQTWFIKLALSFIMLLSTIYFCNHYLPGSKCTLSPQALIYINPVSRLFEFVLGMVAALGFRRLRDVNLSYIKASLFEAGGLIIIFISLYFSIPIANKSTALIGLAGNYWLSYSSSCLWFAGIILLISVQKGLLSRILNLRLFILLGEISYSLYLVQGIFINYCINHNHWALKHHPVMSYAVFWLVILTVSFLMWKYIERPSRSFINSYKNLNAAIPINKIFLST